MALVACAPSHRTAPMEVRAGLRLAQPDLAFGPAALDHATAEFLRPASGAGAGAGAGTVGGALGGLASTGGLRADLDLSGLRGQELALAVQMDQALPTGWHLETRLLAGQSDLRRALAPGAIRVGRIVLMEPGEMRARARFVEAQVMALRPAADMAPVWARAGIPDGLDIGAGMGLRVTDAQVRATVRGLIDARSSHRQTQPFGVLQARYTWRTLPARAFAEARVYGRKQAGLRAGLDIILP